MLKDSNIHATFSVDDLQKAKDFYVGKLGLSAIKESPDQKMLLLEAGSGTKVIIYEKADHRPWDSTVMGLEVDDVRQAVEELAAAGTNVEPLPMTGEDGIASDPDVGEAAWFRDPAGNWICISSVAAEMT